MERVLREGLGLKPIEEAAEEREDEGVDRVAAAVEARFLQVEGAIRRRKSRR